MGLILAKDGKRWALEHPTGGVSNYFQHLYVGLLQTLPADYDKLDYSNLVTGNEFTPSADFYTAGRLEVFFSGGDYDPTTGAFYRSNINLMSWPNANADRTIAGVFICETQTGTGNVLWVGPPDIGSMTVGAGSPATIPVGQLVCSID